MSTLQIDITKEDLIVELAEIYSNMPMPYSLSEIARTCLILWAGKYVKDSKKIKIVSEKLKMSAIHIRPLEEELRDAVIDGEITRAEERGIEKGMEKGKEEIIKTMLKQYKPKEISEMTGIDMKQINKIHKGI